MSGKAVGKAFGMRGLTPTEKFVLVAYAEHADQDGSNIFPAVASIAAKTGLSKRSVQRATKRLEELGMLLRDGKGPKSTKKWKLNMAWGVTACHPDRESRVSEGPKGGDTVSRGGDTVSQRGDTVTPKPSLTVNEPSEEPSFSNGPNPFEGQTPQQQMVTALSKVSGLDHKIKRNASRMSRVAKELREAGYGPEYVLAHFSPGGWWYERDWRGVKGQTPTPEQVLECVGKVDMPVEGKPKSTFERNVRAHLELLEEEDVGWTHQKKRP